MAKRTTPSLPSSGEGRESPRDATISQLRASRRPRIRVEPVGAAFTDGPDAAALCEHYWFDPDPWQRDILDCWLSRDADGRLLVISAGLSCPRQNGKNGVIECLEFYLLVTDPNTHILHTAHSTKTAQKAFERMVRVFTGKVPGKGRQSRAIQKLVDKREGGRIRYTNGEWAIYLSSGASIEYCTRTNSGGRGFDAITLLVYDECQQLTDEQVQAVMATLAASRGDQMIIYAGTPPNETAPGDVFARRRSAAINDPGKRVSWHEWSVESLPPEGSTFEDLLPTIYETNPSMELDRPGHLRQEFTEQEFIDMDFEGFCRERLGWWCEAAVINPALDPSAWKACAIDNPTRATTHVRRAIGVKFSNDGAHVAVSVAIQARGRKPHVELMEFSNISAAGVTPLANRLNRIRKSTAFVLIDGLSNADALMSALAERRYPAKGYGRTTPKDAVAAASELVNAVREGSVTHFGQEALDDSALTSTKRDIGNYGGFGFGGTNPEPLDSAAFALHALRTTKRNPSRRMRLL